MAIALSEIRAIFRLCERQRSNPDRFSIEMLSWIASLALAKTALGLLFNHTMQLSER